MEAHQKLQLLADASRFDLSCACGTKKGDHRTRGQDGLWLYPVSLPSGGVSIMLKTLLSNACVNDCRYCPFRSGMDGPRTQLLPEEVAELFMGYVRRGGVFGLFLSSGVVRDPDHTMDRMVAVAQILRRGHRFRGYIHMKVIPGASDAAIEGALALSSAVSLNIETPTRAAFEKLSTRKDFDRDIVQPIKRISRLTGAGAPYARVKQTTQFIVGASDESDRSIVAATYGLYKRLGLARVYYSAYQRGLGDSALPGERATGDARALLTREHRLYQVDWLIRKYGFRDEEIPYEPGDRLSLTTDPKTLWAQRHPEMFPLDIHRADKFELLRVPGLGPTTVQRILEARKDGGRIGSLSAVGRPCKRLEEARGYLKLG